MRLNDPFSFSKPGLLHVSYQRLLQTISVLEAQRTQAILDLETLACHQREALGDPIRFVEQLQEQVMHLQKDVPVCIGCHYMVFVLKYLCQHYDVSVSRS